jgi:BirA family biotin operon repressor/biotin-[acetyl-CoA-carboxylase] ligase
MTGSPSLPAAYELIVYEAIDSVVEEAKRLAVKGAEEGTIVWAKQQTAAQGRLGRPWLSPPGNLQCAIILRLDDPPDVATQVMYVAAVSLAAAIANLVMPQTELRFRWPNDVLLYDAKAAGLWLHAADVQDGVYPWLVLGVGVNVDNFPAETEQPVTSMRFEGGADTSAGELLEIFSRHFLSWINRWAEEGFSTLQRAWSLRPNGLGQPMTLRLKSETLDGTFAAVADEGSIIVELVDKQERRVSIREFFDI